MADALEILRSRLAGRYAIEREVGRGGMATGAEDSRHHRAVAIKVLNRDVADAIGHGRFLREIEIAARLQHPNILAL
jgi:serine/threonine-protein kinase